MDKATPPVTQEAAVLLQSLPAPPLQQEAKDTATPASYHAYRGTVLTTLVRSLAKSCYLDFIDLKKKSDVREGRKVA